MWVTTDFGATYNQVYIGQEFAIEYVFPHPRREDLFLGILSSNCCYYPCSGYCSSNVRHNALHSMPFTCNQWVLIIWFSWWYSRATDSPMALRWENTWVRDQISRSAGARLVMTATATIHFMSSMLLSRIKIRYVFRVLNFCTPKESLGCVYSVTFLRIIAYQDKFWWQKCCRLISNIFPKFQHF